MEQSGEGSVHENRAARWPDIHFSNRAEKGVLMRTVQRGGVNWNREQSGERSVNENRLGRGVLMRTERKEGC